MLLPENPYRVQTPIIDMTGGAEMFDRETFLFCFAHHTTLWINYPSKKKVFTMKNFFFSRKK